MHEGWLKKDWENRANASDTHTHTHHSGGQSASQQQREGIPRGRSVCSSVCWGVGGIYLQLTCASVTKRRSSTSTSICQPRIKLPYLCSFAYGHLLLNHQRSMNTWRREGGAQQRGGGCMWRCKTTEGISALVCLHERHTRLYVWITRELLYTPASSSLFFICLCCHDIITWCCGNIHTHVHITISNWEQKYSYPARNGSHTASAFPCRTTCCTALVSCDVRSNLRLLWHMCRVPPVGRTQL